jgi:hypothetical protein
VSRQSVNADQFVTIDRACRITRSPCLCSLLHAVLFDAHPGPPSGISPARWPSHAVHARCMESARPHEQQACAPGRRTVGAVLRVMGLDQTPDFTNYHRVLNRNRWSSRAIRGIYRDPVRSSHGPFVKASGLRWLSLMLLPRVPWTGRVWGLPFLTALAPSERYASEGQRRHTPPPVNSGRRPSCAPT